MTGAIGFVTAGAQYALDSILIKPKRLIGKIAAQVTIEEEHNDELEITDHPVEQGAAISDHAFKRPAELTMRLGWSNSPTVAGLFQGAVAGIGGTVSGVQSLLSGSEVSQVKAIYEQLLALQISRVPFDVYTGKRFYKNMLVRGLSMTTDKDTENSLMVTMRFRQVLIVQTQLVTITAAAADQANPSLTAPTSNQGTKALVPRDLLRGGQ